MRNSEIARRRFLEGAGLAAAAPFIVPAVQAQTAAPIAETRDGRVRGQTVNGIHVFRGIPYGGDTSAKNRFMPPTRPKPWTGVRDAIQWGRVAPQPPASGRIEYTTMVSWMSKPGGEGEDCLVLNVYTPGLKDGGKRPVMFSIHGGGFTTGTSGNPVFNGVPLARFGNVVVVTINHRLGALGYLHLGDMAPEFSKSGVAGMLDIVAALEWVRDNIANFGGDPGNVTIFGQSGGGSKVCNLMAMPAAKGLFHRAAVQSGAGLRSGTREAANATAEKMLAQIDIPKSRVRELQQVPLEMMIGAQIAVGGQFGPFVDGDVIPRNPFDPGAPEISADVPVLVGACLHDSAFTRTDYNLDEAGLEKQAGQMFGADGARVLEAYRAADPKATPFLLMARMMSDRGTRRSSITLAERKAALGKAPAFMYLIAWPSRPYGGKYGAVHGMDVPLIFHNPAAWPLTDGGAEALAMADKVAGAWVALAKNGNPGWPAYNTDTRATMVFNTVSRVENNPDRELLELNWRATPRPTGRPPAR